MALLKSGHCSRIFYFHFLRRSERKQDRRGEGCAVQLVYSILFYTTGASYSHRSIETPASKSRGCILTALGTNITFQFIQDHQKITLFYHLKC